MLCIKATTSPVVTLGIYFLPGMLTVHSREAMFPGCVPEASISAYINPSFAADGSVDEDGIAP